MNRERLLRYGSAVVLVFLLFRAAWWFLPDIFGVWELQAGDQLMRLAYSHQGRQDVSPDIVHIDLDDRSLATLPYSKNDPRLYAELFRILSLAGTGTIMVDMLFPVCRQEECRLLAAEAAAACNILFPVILSPPGRDSSGEPAGGTVADRVFLSIAAPGDYALPGGSLLMSNDESLDRAAAGLGHINCPPDRDGVYRRIPLFIRGETGLAPSLALLAAASYLELAPEKIRLEENGTVILPDVTLPGGQRLDVHIPVDREGRNRINFAAPWHDAYAHYSFATILEQAAAPSGLMELTDELDGTLAIVSDVSTGGRDFGPVPFSSYSPLSGLYSHFSNSVLTNNFLREIGPGAGLLLDLALFVLLVAAALWLRGCRLTLAAGLLCCGFLGLGLYLFLEGRTLIPLVRPSLSIVAALSLVLLFQFLEVQQEKQFIRATLGSYFAPPLMEKILNEPDRIRGVTRKELTVLFSDIAGFTSWSAERDPAEIHRTLNQYFSAMAEIIFTYEGTIDKYIGDGLMVFFGDPIPCPDHAMRAVQAAMAMQRKTRELRSKWEQAGGMPLEIRIGIHSGEVVVGNMGSDARMDYTVIGSNVNLAQRLETLCPPGGILVSEEIFGQLNGTVDVKPAGTVRAKGFAEPLPVYEVETGRAES
jgi:adenylate cyclase